ncbi:MAG: SymE family type I addiction module toxin [Acidobacteria bacterium]|nr:SymE family type I addiction module toxin [Acidobacteriota bacterium]
MREQKLTVSGLYRPGWHAFPQRQRVPLLQLVGPWLEEVGFHEGAQVRVQMEAGRLVVERRREDDGGEGG